MKGNGLDQKEVTKYITTNDEVKSSDDFSNLITPIRLCQPGEKCT